MACKQFVFLITCLCFIDVCNSISVDASLLVLLQCSFKVSTLTILHCQNPERRNVLLAELLTYPEYVHFLVHICTREQI